MRKSFQYPVPILFADRVVRMVSFRTQQLAVLDNYDFIGLLLPHPYKMTTVSTLGLCGMTSYWPHLLYHMIENWCSVSFCVWIVCFYTF